MLIQALTALSFLGAAALTLLSVYLLVLLLAAGFGRRAKPPRGDGKTYFAVLVPAHGEELLLGRLLKSLAAQDYPASRFEVFVVADNCEDATARVAAEHGAITYERFDPTAQGKGQALRWLLARVRRDHSPYDAYVIFDADSIVDPGYLRSMDGHLQSGAGVVQGYYSVLNVGESPLATLRYAALTSLHLLRPLGREAMGLSCGLKGNGMCFRAHVIDRFGWQWYTLAEDVEFHLALVRGGVRVVFAPEARVAADMPLSFTQAATQNARWERGRLQMLRHRVPSLVADGLCHRSLVCLDAALEQLIPPMSIPFALGAGCLLVGLALGSTAITMLALVGLGGQVLHILAGLILSGAPARAYLALGYSPIYIAWKLWIYGQALVSTRTMRWIRTSRAHPPADQGVAA